MTNQITIATWNINSVRARHHCLELLVAECNPDILCLQEIKCDDGSFPEKAIKALGFEHVAFNGQKSYHGVATFSKIPFTEIRKDYLAGNEEARHLFTAFDSNGTVFGLHNFYVPAGGDEPDIEKNPKFGAKLNYLDAMKEYLMKESKIGGRIVVGDLNVAPYEHDVWSHKQLLKVVSHTPVEAESLETVRQSGEWQDIMRHFIPSDQPLFSWWSYRAKDWRKSNKGRRLDHIWSTHDLLDKFTQMEVYDVARDWTKTSDHAPVIAKMKV